MSIITTLSQEDFISEFRKMSDTYNNQFSYEGLKALYDYLDEYSEAIEESLEFDPIAYCCKYTEYKDLEEIQATYSNIKDMDDLQNNTEVIEFDGGVIIQDF